MNLTAGREGADNIAVGISYTHESAYYKGVRVSVARIKSAVK